MGTKTKASPLVLDKIPHIWEVTENLDSDIEIFLTRAVGRPLAVDTETNAEDIRDGRGFAMGASIAYRISGAYYSMYFPFKHRGAGNLGPETLARVKELIENAPALIFHNAKFDIASLATLGITVPSGRWFCTMIMCHLINENYPYSKSLNDCCKHYLGPEWVKDDSEIKDIVAQVGWSFVPASTMKKYAALDPELTYRLFIAILALFKNEGLDEYWTHKARLIEVVMVMESRGVGIDVEYCKTMLENAEHHMGDYEEMLGWINPSKPSEMYELFINRLKLPVVKTSKKTGKPSFDKEAVAIYEQLLENSDSEIAEWVLSFRGWQKAKSAFYGAYLEHLSPDGRLRPSYRHHKDDEEGGTVTGRLSCANPNLQQIPRKSEKPWNGGVKKAFVATPGYTLYEADYSQLELRLGTAYANEASLKQVFEEGRDIFTELAAMLGWIRQNVKTFVYSTQYGAGKKRISDVFGVSHARAQELIDNYYEMFPGFKRVAQIAHNKCFADRKIKLWSGRYRHFHSPRDEAHKAFNSVIQGGAADIVECVMVHVYDTIDQASNGEVRMLLQVHDSIVFEIKNGTQKKWLPKIKETMSDVQAATGKDFEVVFDVQVKQFGGAE